MPRFGSLIVAQASEERERGEWKRRSKWNLHVAFGCKGVDDNDDRLPPFCPNTPLISLTDCARSSTLFPAGAYFANVLDVRRTRGGERKRKQENVPIEFVSFARAKSRSVIKYRDAIRGEGEGEGDKSGCAAGTFFLPCSCHRRFRSIQVYWKRVLSI